MTGFSRVPQRACILGIRHFSSGDFAQNSKIILCVDPLYTLNSPVSRRQTCGKCPHRCSSWDRGNAVWRNCLRHSWRRWRDVRAPWLCAQEAVRVRRLLCRRVQGVARFRVRSPVGCTFARRQERDSHLSWCTSSFWMPNCVDFYFEFNATCCTLSLKCDTDLVSETERHTEVRWCFDRPRRF